MEDLKELRISQTFDEIKLMSKNQFTKLLKERLKENAFKYLIDKQGSKGSEIIYLDLSMSEYLLPTNSELTVEQKQRLFAVNKNDKYPLKLSKTRGYIYLPMWPK